MQFYQQSTQHVYSSRICIPVRQESSILTKGLSMIIPCIARPYHSFSHQATATCSPTATIGVVTRQDREFLVYLLSVQLATWPMGWMSFIVLVGRFSEVDHETELATKNKKGLLIFMGFALVGWKKKDRDPCFDENDEQANRFSRTRPEPLCSCARHPSHIVDMSYKGMAQKDRGEPQI